MSKKSYEIDMCNGPLLGKILLFTIPLMLSGLLQLLFNAVDMVVAGRYIGSEALAAIGSTSSLTNLLVNVFMGLSVGANVLVAHYYGAGQTKDVAETVHTSILLSLLSGVLLSIIGILLAKPLLLLMGTPPDVLEQAATYMKIYFLGMPVMLFYNFGSSILRATGDTRRPLYYLTIAGVINVLLNINFVVVFHMGIEGTAMATVISQTISALLLLRCMITIPGAIRLEFSKLRLNYDKVLRILRIGLPAGVQGAIFSISNVLIQSSVNSFGSIAMAGNTATSNLEGFIYTAMNSFYQTSLTFTSQNLGARRYHRIRKILFICISCVIFVGASMGYLGLFFGKELLGVYSPNPNVISYGLLRMQIIFSFYFFCGIMDVMVGSLRGIGYSIMPMLVSLIGACGLRVLWVFTIFSWHRTLTTLYISYPVSWALTAFVHIICFTLVYRKLMNAHPEASC